LGFKSLWTDELYSYLFSSQNTFLNSFVFMLSDLSPPLYYTVLFGCIKLFGNTEFILRLPSFFAGGITVIIVYCLSQKVFNKNIALGAAILTGFSPFLIYYSQEARPYSLFVLFCSIVTIIWAKIIKNLKQNNQDLKNLKIYTIFSLAAIFTHYWAFIPIFFQYVYLFFVSIKLKRNIKPLLNLFINIFIPSGIFFVFQYSLCKNYNVVFDKSLLRVNSSNILEQLINQIFYNNYFLLIIFIAFLAFNFKKLVLFIKKDINENSINSPIIYFSFLIFAALLLYLILDKNSSFLHPRHLIFINIPFYLLTSYIIFSINKKQQLAKIVYLFVVLLVFSIFFLFYPQKIENKTFNFYTKPKQEWRDATEYLVKNYKNGDIIITDRIKDFYNYYFNQLGHDINNFNIIFDRNMLYKNNSILKIKDIKKKNNKIYIFSTQLLGFDAIRQSTNSIRPACRHFERKNFVNINFYECF